MLALGSLLLVIAFSLLIVRIGTIALTMTGLSEDVARFQSLSAFSGAGYTTSEAEDVASEAARRKVVAFLMRAGSVGAVSAIATTILTFVNDGGGQLRSVALLAVGCGVLVALARSERLNRWSTPIIRRLLSRTTDLELRDYAGLLHLHEDWRIAILRVEKESWLAGRSLESLGLWDEGVSVLGVERRDGAYLGVPSGDTELRPGDRILAYGEDARLRELSDRKQGDDGARAQAEREHAEEKARETRQDGTQVA